MDNAFIGSCGINIFNKSIATFHVEDGNTKKSTMDSAKVIYLVMENKKFYLEGMYIFTYIDDIKAVITEEIPNEDICSTFK